MTDKHYWKIPAFHRHFLNLEQLDIPVLPLCPRFFSTLLRLLLLVVVKKSIRFPFLLLIGWMLLTLQACQSFISWGVGLIASVCKAE